MLYKIEEEYDDYGLRALWVVSYDTEKGEVIDWIQKFERDEETKAKTLVDKLNREQKEKL